MASPAFLREAQLVKQGAEARIYRMNFLGKPVMVKERFTKRYRNPEMEEKLTLRRTMQEVRSIVRMRRAGISAPAVYFVSSRCIFLEEVLDSVTVRDHIKSQPEPEELLKLAERIGAILARMHEQNLVHGDLTTSNMLLRGGELVLIDFGLSFVSALVEDKAVDLHVLEKALLSSHPHSQPLFQQLLIGYGRTAPRAVIAKLDEVRRRGRKRSMVG